MYEELDKLQSDAMFFRKAVDRFASEPLTTPSDWQNCFLDILICATQLYLRYLFVKKYFPSLDVDSSVTVGQIDVAADVECETRLRRMLTDKLVSSSSWSLFRANNALSELSGLGTAQHYIDILTLHLPEIYQETFQAETYARELLSTHSASALSQLFVSMEHLGRNHIGFVLQALQWVSDESSWEDPLVTSGAS